MTALYHVTLPHTTFGVAVGDDGRVLNALDRRMVGLPWSVCASWVAGRGGRVRRAG